MRLYNKLVQNHYIEINCDKYKMTHCSCHFFTDYLDQNVPILQVHISPVSFFLENKQIVILKILIECPYCKREIECQFQIPIEAYNKFNIHYIINKIQKAGWVEYQEQVFKKYEIKSIGKDNNKEKLAPKEKEIIAMEYNIENFISIVNDIKRKNYWTHTEDDMFSRFSN